jgi:5'(3')-deoxyribonucleotidase
MGTYFKISWSMKKFLSEEVIKMFLDALEKKVGKKVMWVDMDGVVCDFEKIAAKWAEAAGITMKEFIDSKMYRKPNFYIEMEPMPGAIEALKELGEKYEVRLLSAPSWSAPTSFTEKRLWIENHLGDWGRKRMDLSFRKDLAMGHYLIDDRLKYGAGDFIKRSVKPIHRFYVDGM